MKSMARMTQGELGAFVQTHLRAKGIQVVLSGGAAVSIYTRGKYVSQDLDLINIYSIKRRAIRAAMSEIGFQEIGRYFRHRDTQYLVEFPPGPLTVGAEPVKWIEEVKLSTGILKVISPTDCVKDRLAAYYHWGDRQSLAQALLVAKYKKVNIKEVRRWSEGEGMLGEFNKIRSGLAGETE